MGPTRRIAWRRSATSCAASGAAIEPLQASSVCGVMARQGRCVAEAGVRDAASRVASKHAEAWVCPPASLPWPPLGSDSLSSVPPPLPGFRSWRADSGRRAGPQAGCGGWGQSGATRRRDRSPPVGRPARVHVDAVDVVRAAGYRPLRGLPYIEAAQPGGDHDGDSSAPDRLVVCHRQFGFGSARHGGPRSAREIERFAGVSAAQIRNDEPKPLGNLTVRLAGSVIGTEPRSRYLPNLPWQEGVSDPAARSRRTASRRSVPSRVDRRRGAVW